jgi:hypothetical protein
MNIIYYERWSKEEINISESKSSLLQVIRGKFKTQSSKHTGTSITLTKVLVLRSPMITLHSIKEKNRATRRATDAGKETELNPMRLLTPKHVSKIIKIPTGT